MINFTYQKKRSTLFSRIRSFFDERGYLEVFTPSLSPTLIPEPTIKCFKTEFNNEFTGKKDLFLIPSPEIYMKEMLSYGSGPIYEISQCFRNAEQLGDVHNPEFTMLEYYTPGFTDTESIDLTIEMIDRTKLGDPDWTKNKPLVITVEEAMWKYAGVDMEKAQDGEKLRKEAERLSLYVPEDESWEDTFNKIFLTFVETNIPKDREVYIRDYPKQIECLAEDYPARPYKRRWEMYIAGTEIANCYTEETDKEKIRSYYEREQKRLIEERTKTGDVISSASSSFPELDMPPSSGVAIGLDRLLMVNLGEKEIAPLMAFPLSNLFK